MSGAVNPSHPSLVQDFSVRKSFLNEPQQKKLLAALIDSTLLKTNANCDDFLKLFAEANEFRFRSVCVPPYYVSLAKKHCVNTLVCTVVGFPNGYNTTQNKIDETKQLLDLGADEFDFVNNVTLVKSGLWNELAHEYSSLVKAAQGNITKIILETSLLSDDEIEKCTQYAISSGMHIIKTSTGFGSRGASENDMQIIQSTINKFCENKDSLIGIKASGGVRTFEDALKFIRLGATRIGTSLGKLMVTS